MKGILSILLLGFVSQLSWVDEVKSKIKNIDKTAVLIIDEIAVEKEEQSIYKEYESVFGNKTVIDYQHLKSETFAFNFTFYEINKGLIASYTYGTQLLFHKGDDENKPFVEVYESKKFFKNDSLGVEYYKELEVFKDDDIQTKKEELSLIEFETKALNNSDFMKEKKLLTRVKKNH